MNKAELVAAMSAKTGESKKVTEETLNAFVEVVSEALKGGDKIQLVGFGSFEVRKRAARKGRNPQTKEEIKIPASKAPVFKAGKSLKEIVTFIVINRFEFMKKNHQILRIFIQESLTKIKIRQMVSEGFVEAIKSNQEIFTEFRKLVGSKHPDYDAIVLVRIITGPMIAYFLQRFIFAPNASCDEKRDLDLIITQILSGLE